MEVFQKLGVILIISSFLFATLSLFEADIWLQKNQFRFAGAVGTIGAIILTLSGIIEICIK